MRKHYLRKHNKPFITQDK